MTIMKKLNQHIEEWMLVLLLVVSLSSITLQICMRFIFDNSLAWSEELARYCFIWLIYIGIAYGVKRSRHICLDVVYDIVPIPVKKVMLVASYILVGIFAIVVIYYSYFMIEQIVSFGQKKCSDENQYGLCLSICSSWDGFDYPKSDSKHGICIQEWRCYRTARGFVLKGGIRNDCFTIICFVYFFYDCKSSNRIFTWISLSSYHFLQWFGIAPIFSARVSDISRFLSLNGNTLLYTSR